LGYIGSTFFTGNMSYASAFLLSGFVFLLIMATDVTLMTLDRAKPSYVSVMYGESKSRFSQFKDLSGMGLRIGVIFGSLLITAPFVAQIIFSRDIKHEIEFDNKTAISKTRGEIEGHNDTEIKKLKEIILAQRDLLPKEISGESGSISGHHGDGPTAKAVKKNIAVYEEQLGELNKARQKELDDFGKALANDDYVELRNRWGITLADASPVTRGEMLKRIEATPAYKRTERAIRALLGFLFLSLLILKIYEPRAVKIYLSEALQDEWDRYLAGAFDSWLQPGDRSIAKPSAMTPFTFEDLMLHVFPIQRKRFLSDTEDAEARRRDFNDSKELEQLKEDLKTELTNEIKELGDELAAVEKKIIAESKAYEVVLAEYQEQKNTFERSSRDLKEFERISIAEDNVQSAVSPRMKRVLERLANSADKAESDMEQSHKELASLENRKQDMETHLREFRGLKDTLSRRFVEAQAELNMAREGIVEIKLHRIEEIRARRTQQGQQDSTNTESSSWSARSA
jgi:hypothetical protein